MWAAILEALKIFGLFAKQWAISSADQTEKKKAMLAYYEAREKFAGGGAARAYWEAERQKLELQKEE